MNNYQLKHLNAGDAFGNNSPNDKFNKELVPILSKYNVSLNDFEKVYEIVRDIYNIGYENGEHDEAFYNSEYN